MRPFMYVPLLAIVLVISSAHAAGQQRALDLKAVASQQEQIRTDILAANGSYRGLSPSKQAELLERSGKLSRLIEGKQSPSELTDAERMQAINTLEWIDATLSNEEGDRMMCSYQKTIGSNRKTRVCKTAEQVERERDEARERLSKPDISTGG